MQVTTFGKKGAMLLKRVDNPTGAEPEATLESVMKDLNQKLDLMPTPVAGKDEPGCMSAGDIPIFPGNVVKSEQPVLLTFDRCSAIISPPHVAPDSGTPGLESRPEILMCWPPRRWYSLLRNSHFCVTCTAELKFRLTIVF